ncbi:energy transducer TonB [Shewanella putrefaciens]|uniref:TonB family protein n=1 Tax=Shewanella putrefaciens TaxID=24 RepID=A0ABX8XEU8_SHEPU|nr:energy transducer TonB [Shewanella putrefaciens]QYX73672.1 TonB family protein [Shewanella putrefaciens]
MYFFLGGEITVTPKRYLAFGALTIAIQSGVIASQPSIVPQQLNAISMTSASTLNRGANHVSLSLAIPVKNLANPDVAKTDVAKTKATEPIITPPKSTESNTEQTITAKVENHSIKSTSVDTPMLKPSSAKTASQAKTVNPPTEAEPRLADATLSQLSEITTANHIEKKQAKTEMAAELTQSTHQTTSIKTNIVELEKPLFTTPPPRPNYPRIARKKGLEGTAMVEVMFNEWGEQLALTLVKSSGFSLLDKAALEAVETWQFEAPPQKLASHYKVRVPIRFALN